MSKDPKLKLHNNPELDQKFMMSKKSVNGYRKYRIDLNEENHQQYSVKRNKPEVFKLYDHRGPGYFWRDSGGFASDQTLKRSVASIPTLGVQELDLTPIKKESLTDRGIMYLSQGLKKLTCLKKIKLDVSHSIITDEGIHHFSQTLKAIPGLQDLTLNLNCFRVTENGIIYLLKSLKSLPSLKNLNFNSRHLTDKGLQNFYKNLAKIVSLQSAVLNLSGNHVTNPGLLHLRKAVRKLTSLQTLSLNFQESQLNGSETIYLCEDSKTSNPSSLKSFVLNLKGCKSFADKGVQNLSEFIKSLPGLQSLDINFSGCQNISDAHIKELSQSLVKLAGAKSLNLDFSDCVAISDPRFLGQSLTELLSLRNLALNFSRCKKIPDDGFTPLAEALANLTSLQTLDLDFSECKQIESLQEMSESLMNLQSLTSLALNFNECKALRNGSETLGEALGLMTSLQTLDLQLARCSNSGSLQELSESLMKLRSLRSLTLDFTNWGYERAPVGKALVTLSSLQTLNLNFARCYHLTDSTLLSMNEGFENLVNLRSLNLDFSGWDKCKEKTMLDFFERLKAHGSLIDLTLQFTNLDTRYFFDSQIISKFSEALKANPCLQDLWFEVSKCWELTCEGLEKLCTNVRALKSLKSVHLSFSGCNSYFEDIEEELLEIFKKVPKRSVHFKTL